jgi:hypothetical protein
MLRAIEARVRKLERARERTLDDWTDAELQGAIEAVEAALIVRCGSVEAVADMLRLDDEAAADDFLRQQHRKTHAPTCP